MKMLFWESVDKGLNDANKRASYFKEKKERYLNLYAELSIEELKERYKRAGSNPEKLAITFLLNNFDTENKRFHT